MPVDRSSHRRRRPRRAFARRPRRQLPFPKDHRRRRHGTTPGRWKTRRRSRRLIRWDSSTGGWADGGVQDAVRGSRFDVLQGLALVGGKRGHINQADDIACVRGGVRDDGASIGVADSQDPSRDLAEHARDVCRIRGYAAQRIDDGPDRDVGSLQSLNDAAPAGASANAP